MNTQPSPPSPLSDQDMLTYAKQATDFFLKNRGTLEHIRYLHGYTKEDIAQEAILSVLASKATPYTRSYISQCVFTTIANLSRKGILPFAYGKAEMSDEALIPLLTSEDILCDLSNQLSTEEAVLFGHCYISCNTISETAGKHGVSERTIKRRLVSLNQHIKEVISG